MVRAQKQLEDEGGNTRILEERQLQLNKFEDKVKAEFKEINLLDPESILRSRLERQKEDGNWSCLPLNLRYRGITNGLSNQRVPEATSVVANIEAYRNKIQALPESERPDWGTQYDEIVNIIVRASKLSPLFLMSKRQFKYGTAEQWAKKVRSGAREGKYTWSEILGSVKDIKWTTTKLDHLVRPDQEDWDLLEGWGRYLDMATVSPKRTKYPQNKNSKSAGKQTIVCGHCKKNGHKAKDCYQRKREDKETSQGAVRAVGESINERSYVASVVLGRKTIEVLRDTGATASFIRRNIAKELIREHPDYKILKCKGVFTCANDTDINCDEQLQGRVTYKGVDLGIHRMYVTDAKKGYPIIAGGRLLEAMLDRDGIKFDENPKSHSEDSNTNSEGNGIANPDKDRAKVDYVKSTYPTKQADEAENKRSQIVKSDVKSVEKEQQKECEAPEVEIYTEVGKKACVYRHMTPDKMDVAREVVKPLVKKGYIEPVANGNGWMNPIVLVRKPNGSYRLCNDFRKLNSLVEQDNHPIPTIHTITDSLRDCNIFSVMDCKDGFFSIPLREEDRDKTAFKIGAQFYRYKVMPMGFRNAPNIFQRTMEGIFADLIEGNKLIVYIDDILVVTKQFNEHRELTKEVMRRLVKHGFSLNWEKSKFAREQIEFLGHKISLNRIDQLESRVQGILDYPEPKTLKQARRFIGILAYSFRFLPHIAETLKPLYELMQKDEKFVWSEERSEAFNKAKQKIADAVSLIIPDPTKEFILETDASNIGIGAVLRQEEGIVAFYSRLLRPSEKKYTATEKELLASMWGMEKGKHYLSGRRFRLITDHKAITYYHTKDDFGNARISRWYEKLRHYNFYVIYKKGEEMTAPDALSRAFIVSKRVRKARSKSLDNSERDEKILKYHEQVNHRKTILLDLKEQGIELSAPELAKVLVKCRTCLERDGKYVKSSTYVETSEPGEKIGIDLMEYGNYYIIVIIDYFTRKVYAKLATTKQSNKILTFLKETYKHLIFKEIISDRGREFENTKLKEWTKQMGIHHHLRPAYYHKGSGRVERVIRTLRTALRKTKGTLKNRLAKIVANYNNQIHRGIGMSPNEAQKEQNRTKVLENSKKYKREFIEKDLPKYTIGDRVLIKKDVRDHKDDRHFEKEAEIINILGRDTYSVITPAREKLTKHYSQLKLL